MTIFDSMFLGAVEGFAEILPISSTGHLIVASKLLDIEQTEATKAYEIIIQLAAILALMFNYRNKFRVEKINLWSKVVLAFLPIGTIGFIFASQVKALFSINIVAIMFIVGGVAFLIVEKFFIDEKSHFTTDVESVTFKQAMIIGLAQILALIPGTSRTGSTVIGALLVGLNRKTSVEFSFLLAFPVMIAVSGYELLKHYKEFSDANLMVLAVGFGISFVVAYFTIKLFLKFLDRFTFVAFGIYRIIFGIFLLLYFN